MGNMFELSRSSLTLSSAFTLIFAFCYFGEKVTSAFDELHESINQCHWYLFPLEMKKYLTTILMISGKPVHMRAFASFNCTLHTFKLVSFFLSTKENHQIFLMKFISFRLLMHHISILQL